MIYYANCVSETKSLCFVGRPSLLSFGVKQLFRSPPIVMFSSAYFRMRDFNDSKNCTCLFGSFGASTLSEASHKNYRKRWPTFEIQPEEKRYA